MGQKDTSPELYWNIFARELRNVLNRHKRDLEDLDVYVGIHPETARLIILSLDTPPSLPVLNIEEMELLMGRLHLEQHDILRLKAAMLTTAIQRELALHIRRDDARLAADQIFPTIFKSLEEQANERKLGNERGGDMEGRANSELDFLLIPALNALHSGWEKLSQSEDVREQNLRVKKAHEACRDFTEAITYLESLNSATRLKPGWKHKYRDAQKGLALAQKQLKK